MVGIHYLLKNNLCIIKSFIFKILYVVFNTGKSMNNNHFPLEIPINKRKHNDMLTEFIIHSNDSNGSIATTFDELIQVLPDNNFESEVSLNFAIIKFSIYFTFLLIFRIVKLKKYQMK